MSTVGIRRRATVTAFGQPAQSLIGMRLSLHRIVFPTPNAPSLRHLISGALATTVSRIVDIAASGLFYLILSRVLGAGRFGLFALALTVVKATADLCRLGVDQGAMRFVAQYRAHGQSGEVRAAAESD